MGFEEREQRAIWSTIGVILHLGNMDFDDRTLDNNNPCSVVNSQELQLACELLGCDIEKITSGLVNKSRTIGNQIILGRMSKADCQTTRDSFSKALYERLFTWLIRRLNYAIAAEEYKFTRFEDVIKDTNRLSIGLLDIFGFEVFKNNSFEQFCINFANEKLQQLYIAYVFKAEINEFLNEGLKDFLFELDFQDNQPLIEMLEQYPMGIFNLLDESSGVASTDEALLQNMIKNHKSSKNFRASKTSKFGFVISHTASEVEYNIQGFR
jgi:myosin heavy subunit